MNLSLRLVAWQQLKATMLWTPTSCSSLSMRGEELGVRRPCSRDGQGHRASGPPHLQGVREPEVTVLWEGDSLGSTDSRHRRKYSKSMRTTGCNVRGSPWSSARSQSRQGLGVPPCHWQALVRPPVSPLEGCEGNASPRSYGTQSHGAWVLGPLCHEPTVWRWAIHLASLGTVH